MLPRRAFALMRSLLIEPRRNVVHAVLVKRPVQTACAVTDMRRTKQVIQCSIWVIQRQRLDIEHVQRRSCDRACLECGNQRRFGYDRSSRCIDQMRGWLHQRYLGPAYQTPGPIAKDNMYGEEIRSSED